MEDFRINGNTLMACTTNKEHIVIPDGVEIIMDNAFAHCKKIKTVKFADSVNYIGTEAFRGCFSLEEIVFNKTSKLRFIGKDAFYSTVLNKCTRDFLPDSLEIIGKSAFGNTNLIAVALGSNVKTVGDQAFCACPDLTHFWFNNNVEEIGNAMFFNCADLKLIKLPQMTEIPENMFYKCSSLTNIELPNDLTCISYNAFLNCDNLTTIDIPANVDNISTSAFEKCKNLKVLNIGTTRPDFTFGFNSFKDCTSLEQIIFADDKKADLVEYFPDIFVNCPNIMEIDFPSFKFLRQHGKWECYSWGVN